MLKIIRSIQELDFRQLMDVYEETNRCCGQNIYPKESVGLQMLFAEQDFYGYLEVFFRDPVACYAVWCDEGRYKAALRLEGYNDGLLITALEVLPGSRRQGLASKLVEAVKLFAGEIRVGPLYSHVHNENTPSFEMHKKCGFRIVSNSAIFLDGTKHLDHSTFVWKY